MNMENAYLLEHLHLREILMMAQTIGSHMDPEPSSNSAICSTGGVRCLQVKLTSFSTLILLHHGRLKIVPFGFAIHRLSFKIYFQILTLIKGLTTHLFKNTIRTRIIDMRTSCWETGAGGKL